MVHKVTFNRIVIFCNIQVIYNFFINLKENLVKHQHKLSVSQQAFPRCFNIVFWLIWRHDVGQRQINVETTLYISTLEFTTSKNVESTLRISALMWITLDNVVLFNVKFCNVGQRGNNVVKMTISKKNEKKSFQISILNSKF